MKNISMRRIQTCFDSKMNTAFAYEWLLIYIIYVIIKRHYFNVKLLFWLY